MSKILIVGPAYPFRGGLSTFNERLCKEFRNLGHECDVLSFSLQYPSFLFPGKTQYTEGPPPEDLRIIPAINSINPFNWISVGRKIRSEKYDLVVFRYWMSFMAPAFGTIARMVKGNGHSRIVAITDNIVPHEKRFFDTLFTKYFLSACDGFLTMSQAVLGQLKAFNQHKPATYVPHPMYDMYGEATGKEEAKKKLGLDTNTNYLLFFGFIRKYKGLHLLLDAFADERLKSLNLKLIVAGEFYENPKPYFDQVKALNLEDRVIMSNDFIPNSEISAHFCAADVVVQTYLDATQSGVTQIAYYYNKPMIVTNVGGLAELVPDHKTGLVVGVDREEITNAIHAFYTEKKEQLFVSNMPAEKERFTWPHLCKQLLSLVN